MGRRNEERKREVGDAEGGGEQGEQTGALPTG